MDFSNDFNESIKDSELDNLTIDILEKIIDDNISEGILKEIPILNTIKTIWNVKNNISEYLFTKKIIHFINKIKDIPKSKRLEMINKIDNDDNYKTKVGEKLIFLINKADDIEKSEILGLLFKKFLSEEISYYTFIRFSKVIDISIDEELEFFTNYLEDKIEVDRGSHYISLNLYDIKFNNPKLIEEENLHSYTEGYKYSLEELDIYAEINNYGKQLRNILKEYYQ